MDKEHDWVEEGSYKGEYDKQSDSPEFSCFVWLSNFDAQLIKHPFEASHKFGPSNTDEFSDGVFDFSEAGWFFFFQNR